ncbi:Carboxylesterase A precursor [Nocardioides dokdonensis FR1436]|uniref:Carboxylesterase A n=1 Tax=Nocardioides dokdonensis FR1436 TaxID=1300347 RepID=A0A1A9GIN2_9ACTN|nr:Carboxylesterase A precursor [Nocardioides dokdonensis FR1436]
MAALAVSVPLLASLAVAPAVSVAPPLAPLLAPPGVGAAASAPRADLPRIRWRDCGRRIDCGRVDAPLDYDKPDGATVGLNLLRVRARKQARRVGAIFVNPGGPGGAAADFAPYAASQMFDRKIRNRFDVIGIDPRGVGGSQGLYCRGRSTASYPAFAFPDTRHQIRVWRAFDAAEHRLCAGKRIVDHMSTADTARDMDLVRRILGDEQASFYGASYGSVLGATWASMFPDTVRAAVVDGVLDPVAWTTGRDLADGTPGSSLPSSGRLGSEVGAREGLAAGLAECDAAGRQDCRLAGDALARWDAVAARLRSDKQAARAIGFSYSDFVGTTLGLLYGGDLDLIARITFRAEKQLARTAGRPATGEPAQGDGSLRRLVREARQDLADSPFPGPYAASGAARRPAKRLYVDGSFHGVLCTDGLNPTDPQAWVENAERTRAAGGADFGPLWSWASSACAGWPGSAADAYRGPFEMPDAQRLLLVSNRYDPATPLSGALALQRLMPGSRLVVTQDTGHVATGTNKCATAAVRDFLRTAQAPAEDVACGRSRSPF